MLGRIAILAFLITVMSAPAFAGSCPRHMKAIDAQLSKANISASVKEQIQKLRAEGERLHKAGQHGPSVEALEKAEKLLGIK